MSDIRSTSAMRARRENEIRHMMTEVFRKHREAKEAFEKRLAEGQLLNAFAIRPVIRAQADMLPWVRVQQLTRVGMGLYPAMLEIRQNCLTTIIGYGEAQSSDLIALDLDRAEREGMRRFLKATARFTPPPAVAVPVLRNARVDSGTMITNTTAEKEEHSNERE